MHETALVRSLLAQVDQLRAAHGADQVREVRLEVGPLSGVEPSLVASAFARLQTETASLATAKLCVDEVALEARCQSCGHVFQPAKFNFRCTACGGGDTEIVRGDGVVLQAVVLDDAHPGAIA